MRTFHTVTVFFCHGASWGGFFAAVPGGFFATVPACRRFFASSPTGFFASVSTSRQGNFKTPRRIADDHNGGLCFEPVLVVVVAVAVAGGAGAGVAVAGGAVRGGKLKE